MLVCKNKFCRNHYLPSEAEFVMVERVRQDGTTFTDSNPGTPWCSKCKEPASDIQLDLYEAAIAKDEERLARHKRRYQEWFTDDSTTTRDVAFEDPLDMLSGDPHGVADGLREMAIQLKKAEMYVVDNYPSTGWHPLVHAWLYHYLDHELGWRFDNAYTALARLSETFDSRVGRVFLQTSPDFDAYGVAIEMLDVDALMAKCDSPDLQVSDYINTKRTTPTPQKT